MRKGFVIFFLIAFLFSCAALAETAASSADAFSIPRAVRAGSLDDFVGLWEARYYKDGNRAPGIEEKMGSTKLYFRILGDTGLGFIGDRHYPMKYAFNDGQLSMDDGYSVGYGVLQDDGTLLIDTGSYAIYFFRIEPEHLSVDYETIASAPEEYRGQIAVIEGSVLDSAGSSTWSFYDLYIALEDDSTRIICVEFVDPPASDYDVGSKVKLEIRFAGDISYITGAGEEIMVPYAYIISAEPVE